jgi:hypothetical protein
MPVQATVILDSGCLLQGDDNSPTTEVGYFQSDQSAWDIRVISDGQELEFEELRSLGENCTMEIRHVKADGTINQEGARASKGFHDHILHLRELYGVDTPVDRSKFDCILRFDAGLFCAALLKPRAFKLHEQQEDGQLAYVQAELPRRIDRPIAHNIHVHFQLDDGDAIELARDGTVFWTSNRISPANRLEIEIIADNATAEKFYCHALKGNRSNYWLPNQGDPPPVCPIDPCRPPHTSIL